MISAPTAPIGGMSPLPVPNVDPFSAFVPRVGAPISGQPPVIPPSDPGVIAEPAVGGAAGFQPPGTVAPGGADYQPWQQTAPDASRYRKVKGATFGAPPAPPAAY